MPWPLRQFAEVGCWGVGLVSVALYFAVVTPGEIGQAEIRQEAFGQGEIGQRDDLAEFTGADSVSERWAWSEGRIDAFDPSGSMSIAPLRITRVNFESPMYETPTYTEYTEHNLDTGTRTTDGTALPGSDGNIGIATHPDGHFPRLSEVLIRNVIEAECAYAQDVYLDSELYLVGPADTRPLSETEMPAVTPVTCYPFHPAGSAPKSYIAQAVWQLETADPK